MEPLSNDHMELNDLSDLIRAHGKSRQTIDEGYQELLNRFGAVLARVGPDNGSIILQDHWALYYECTGDMKGAIACRELEIARIDRLFEIGGPIEPVNQEFLLEQLSYMLDDYICISDTERAKQIEARIESYRRNNTGA